jgi:predicted transcriptional regulator
MKTNVMTVRLTPQTKKKLEALARYTKRSKSHLASEAIADYVDRNAQQVDEIRRGLDEIRSGTDGVPQDEVEEWVHSCGTDNELPRPRAQQS